MRWTRLLSKDFGHWDIHNLFLDAFRDSLRGGHFDQVVGVLLGVLLRNLLLDLLWDSLWDRRQSVAHGWVLNVSVKGLSHVPQSYLKSQIAASQICGFNRKRLRHHVGVRVLLAACSRL